MRRPLLLSILVWLSSALTLWGQVGAVQVRLEGEGMVDHPRFPLLTLGGKERLNISFDLLGDGVDLLSYRLVSYNMDWTPSPLLPVEYIQGFDASLPLAPKPSQSTLVPYAHYSLTFPSEGERIKRSGNYKLEFYSEHDPSRALLEIPFAVVEPLLELHTELTDAAYEDYRGRHQQVNLRVTAPSFSPPNDDGLRIIVLQNARWDNAVTLTTPYLRLGQELHFEQSRGARFPAGNNYHRLEHLSDRAIGLGIERVTLEEGRYTVYLHPIRNESEQAYRHEESHQGLQIIRTAGSDTPGTEADYHKVQFRFLSPKLEGGDVLLEGEAFRYLPLSERILRYNQEEGMYEGSVLLKMGYQEYQILFQPRGSQALLAQPTLGDHYQTKNRYTVLVYYRSRLDKTERLLATQEL